jgi:hypothetical protein
MRNMWMFVMCMLVLALQNGCTTNSGVSSPVVRLVASSHQVNADATRTMQVNY